MTFPPRRLVLWKQAWRIIPTRYPEESVYALIAAKGHWDVLRRLERFTNAGVQQEEGDRRFLRESDQLPKGKSAYNIGRPFAFPRASRFSNGRYGAFYAARTLRTAVRERLHHTAKFLADGSVKPSSLMQRVLVARLHGRFHDVRGRHSRWPSVYRANDYTAAQALGAALWKAGSAGIVYDSVRDPGGECAAVFSPQAVSHVRQERCLQFEWDGERITRVYEAQEFIL